MIATRRERLAQDRPQVVDGDEVGRVDHADDEPAVVPAQHGRLVAAGEVIGEQRRQGRRRSGRPRVVRRRSKRAAGGTEPRRSGDDSGAALGGPNATNATARLVADVAHSVGRVVCA